MFYQRKKNKLHISKLQISSAYLCKHCIGRTITTTTRTAWKGKKSKGPPEKIRIKKAAQKVRKSVGLPEKIDKQKGPRKKCNGKIFHSQSNANFLNSDFR